MADRFRVDPDGLEMHARELDALAGRVRDTAGLGRPLDLAAYGLVGRVFALAAVAAAGSGAAAVGRLAEHTAEQSARIRASRESYLGAERRAAGDFGGVR